MKMIELAHVSKAYIQDGHTTEVLKDFSLSVNEGEFLTVIGTSGCGKTTFLKMINGLIVPEKGKVLIKGRDIAGMDLIALRRTIGYAIQGVGLFPHMTVEKNMRYVPSLSRETMNDGYSAKELCDIVGLDPELLIRYPGELSGGQQQRVGIARAIASRPEILLMDEPFGAVDEITRRRLQKEMARIHRELQVTVVFVTHDIREAMLLGNRIAVMDAGKLVQLGTAEDIRLAPATDFVKELVG